MASIAGRRVFVRNWPKYVFFVAIGVAFVAVFRVDELFWFDSASAHARRILAVRGLLIFHGLTGLCGLVAGTLQMSSRIRLRRPGVHRQLGNLYIGAICLSAPIAIYIGISRLEPDTIHVEQAVQGGLWLACALIAWGAARIGQMTLHRDWMIRSYGFTLVFVTSRVPDVIWSHYSDQFLSDMLWCLILIALIAPEIITAMVGFRRAWKRPRPASRQG